jgi:NAD-dependent DNA ligase
MSYTESELVNILTKASNAYYNNTKEGLLEDEDYDRLRDLLEEMNPTHPFLKQVGAPVEKGAVKLPYKMASLNKIKPGSGAVESFVKASQIPAWVLTDKLDGISVLWDVGKQKMYLRGDGLLGVDVTQFAPYIHGVRPRGFQQKWVLRGELVLPNNTPIEGALSRSWVNGQLHQKTPIPEQLGKIHFVAYEILVPSSLSRLEQLQKLAEAGFEVPWACVVTNLSDDMLSTTLHHRRKESNYPIDGIVVGENCVPKKQEGGTSVENPKDMRAFKMPMDDQRATTTVVDILWSASYQGYWIPRLQIHPVTIGGSRIEFLTGHNARFVLTNEIGKGAVIVVRKSGDVIPTLDSVITKGAPIQLPEGEWDGDVHTASHYKLKAGTSNTEVLSKKLEHFAKTLDIPHLGPGLVAKLVAEGKDTPNDLLTIEKIDLELIVGKGMAAKIYPVLQEKLQSCSELTLMIASGLMPRGVGNTKLEALFALQSDPRKWSSIKSCEGWSPDALASFLATLPTYEAWRQKELPIVPYPRLTQVVAREHPLALGVDLPPIKGYVCLTGFRDAEFQRKMEEKGFIFVAGISKKATHLVVKASGETSEKVKKAAELGIRILTREDAIQEYL